MEITVVAIILVVASLYLMHDRAGLNWQARETRDAMARRDEIRDRPKRRRRRRFMPAVGGN
ncbi:hypothetical protein [Gordonia sp. CPCC 205333]|uniref:hypothetical protein n=1 Tax=Gordonia sp. CPCC 205333 TaxID=3140790 RepID=UPI003AF362A5